MIEYESDTSKWLACLNDGLGAASGETMWLLDLPQPTLSHQDCEKLLCFRYYSGLNLSCLAQSEPFASTKTFSKQHTTGAASSCVKRREVPSELTRIKAYSGGGGSSESDSEVEASAKYRRQRAARLIRKKVALTQLSGGGSNKRVTNGYPSHTNGGEESDNSDSALVSSRELHTWNSHECAQRTLDFADEAHGSSGVGSNSAEYYPIWTKSPVVSSSGSVYETLYPSCSVSEVPPPPLPPRASKHRPLERMRALPFYPNNILNPPEVPRQHKPCTKERHLHHHHHHHHQGPGPSLPPKPRRMLNPEDSFAFEIIDTDELLGVDPHHGAFDLPSDPVVKDVSQSTIPTSSLKYKKCSPCSSQEQVRGAKSLDLSFDSQYRDNVSSLDNANNSLQRPVKLGMTEGAGEDGTPCDTIPAVSAPLATPEQDGSLMDSSSVENLVDDEDDNVFLPQDDITILENAASLIVNNALQNLANSSELSHPKYQSYKSHEWPVTDQQVQKQCQRNSKQGYVDSVGGSSSHCKPQQDTSLVDNSIEELESLASGVDFPSRVCDMPVILTDSLHSRVVTGTGSYRLDSRDDRAKSLYCDNTPPDSNLDPSTLLSVPNTSTTLSPVSPNSLSDSVMALSAATECSTSSSSEANTMVLSNRSSSADSLVSGILNNAASLATSNENIHECPLLSKPGDSGTVDPGEDIEDLTSQETCVNAVALPSANSGDSPEPLEEDGMSLSEEPSPTTTVTSGGSGSPLV
ncbi:serine-rich adhesin for platelets-like [Anabrus simplex]|uniref:serine-rich adhesin for platelets-like n=1 Tax=Anabrus simplex TaxID=316456 RepID=UPI0035A2F757